MPRLWHPSRAVDLAPYWQKKIRTVNSANQRIEFVACYNDVEKYLRFSYTIKRMSLGLGTFFSNRIQQVTFLSYYNKGV